MFRFFRRHNWILIVALSATIISFVWFFNPGQRTGGGASSSGDFGSIEGQKITQSDYVNAEAELKLYYLFHYGEWPEKDPNITQDSLQRQIYIRLLLLQKARDFGIHVNSDAAAAAAGDMLRSRELSQALGLNGQAVPYGSFVNQILQPEGLGADDFERFARNDLAIQQLIQTMGLSGTLITPQEATEAYERERQEFSAQAVFFSASNYLSQVAVTPEAVAEFYTNYLAVYRLPDRVQISYVEFNITNFLAQSKAEWAKTNFDQQVNAIYAHYGAQSFPDAKTPEEAKAKIQDILIRDRALAEARAQANEFAEAVFAISPAQPQNLATVAKQKGFEVHVTAPFGSQYGPQEFLAPEGFTKAAFELTDDEPLAGPISGPDAIYVIALDKKLPSEIPSLDEIRAQVAQDFREQQAIALARDAGTNFVYKLAIGMAGGKSFASVSVASGFPPEVLPPFSLSTQELPEIAGRVELNALKQTAFSTPVGHASRFEQTQDGGFVLYVQSLLPVDQNQMNADLPQFTSNLRRSRQQEAFNEWLGNQAHKEFADMKIFQSVFAGAGQ